MLQAAQWLRLRLDGTLLTLFGKKGNSHLPTEAVKVTWLHMMKMVQQFCLNILCVRRLPKCLEFGLHQMGIM